MLFEIYMLFLFKDTEMKYVFNNLLGPCSCVMLLDFSRRRVILIFCLGEMD